MSDCSSNNGSESSVFGSCELDVQDEIYKIERMYEEVCSDMERNTPETFIGVCSTYSGYEKLNAALADHSRCRTRNEPKVEAEGIP